MPRNVEIKARINDIKKINEISEELSNSKPKILKQVDTFFNIENGRLKFREIEGQPGELLFYKRNDVEGPKLSSYEKCSLPTYENLVQVLDKALGIKGIVKKTRLLYLVGQTRVHVDSVEDLGEFVELEVVLKEHQSVEDGEEIAKDLMKKLEIKEENLISIAYMDLILKK